jgi:N6-L-threonylcarbamoyladenine synthase
MSGSIILALATSCADTSAAGLRGESELLGHVIATQDMHAEFGGVVPEVASRAQLQVIDRVVAQTLDQAAVRLSEIDAFAVTAGPGLIGSLLVGLNWVKTAAFALRAPFVGVHHMEAHLFASVLEDERARPPFVALLVSGGHTLLLHVEDWGRYRLLGQDRLGTMPPARRLTRWRGCWGWAILAARQSSGWPGKGTRHDTRSRCRWFAPARRLAAPATTTCRSAA